ncbi:retrovirus-related pol polyprotein from transposon TNT 1-94 [Tanacetum coccineum]
MTGNRKLFSSYKAYNGGNVIFGSNLRGQISDNKCRVTFSEHDSEITKDGKVIGRDIRKKGLDVMKLENKPKDQIFLATIDENSTLWHRRLGHANMRLIQSLASKELVRNIPKLKFDQHFCDACKIRKQAQASHKAKNIVTTTRCLELLHMDLFGPSAVQSYGGNRYTLVIVDDYSRYTWTRFLKDKTEAFDQFEIFSKKIQNQLGCTIVSIRTDHGREFDNEVQFGEFCNANGITHNFSAPRTPQSNGVVERKNRTLQEMKPKNVNEALADESWIVAMQEELNQFIANDVWKLVAQGYNQQEGIDYDETYALVARLDSIRILLAYACALDFKLFQMDVKSAFLNGFINEEKFGLDESKPMNIPMSSDTKLTKDEECESVDSTKYRGMIEFAQILDIPYEGVCVFTDKWSLDELAYGVPTDGLYQTNPLSPNDIISSIRIDREGQVRRIRHEEEIDVLEYQILTREIVPTLNPLEEIIQENVFSLGSYVLYDCVMNPLATEQERKPRKDRGMRRGRHSTSSSPAFDQPSSSHLNDDDDDGNGEGTLRASTPSPIRYVNSLTNEIP